MKFLRNGTTEKKEGESSEKWSHEVYQEWDNREERGGIIREMVT